MTWLHPGKWLLYAAFIASLLLGLWRLDVSRQQIGYDKREAEQAKKDEAATDAAREQETKWQKKYDEVAYDAQEKIAGIEGKLLDARTSADRLRIAARRAASSVQNPFAANTSESQPDSTPGDLLAGLLERHSQELVTVGRFADQLRIAGVACEAADGAVRQGE